MGIFQQILSGNLQVLLVCSSSSLAIMFLSSLPQGEVSEDIRSALLRHGIDITKWFVINMEFVRSLHEADKPHVSTIIKY